MVHFLSRASLVCVIAVTVQEKKRFTEPKMVVGNKRIDKLKNFVTHNQVKYHGEYKAKGNRMIIGWSCHPFSGQV